jgi:hypothetical protein
MADVVSVVEAVTGVEFPAMRREVLRSLASLGDQEYQRRVWIDRVFPHAGFFDDLTLCVHVLYDDCQVLPEPRGRVGSVLVDGEEVTRLRKLGGVLDQLIEAHGDEPDERYLADPRWKEVVYLAGLALASMVRAGEFD